MKKMLMGYYEYGRQEEDGREDRMGNLFLSIYLEAIKA
jgi:hypothetical protein